MAGYYKNDKPSEALSVPTVLLYFNRGGDHKAFDVYGKCAISSPHACSASSALQAALLLTLTNGDFKPSSPGEMGKIDFNFGR